MRRGAINDELVTLVREEMDFLTSEFVARAVRGQGVEVTVDGARHTLQVVPPDFEGLGVFRPLSRNVALLVREATRGSRSG
jgi:hypothetical protein